MTISKSVLMLAASAALLSGCKYAERKDAAVAVQVNTAAEVQAIRGNIDRWLQLIRAKDAANIAQFYTSDGALMAPGMPIAKGHESIQKMWADMMATPGFDLTFATEQIDFSKSGDMALDRGSYRFAATPAAGPVTETGKYVVVWRKVGGEWKAAADIFNSDKPAAGG